MFKMSLSFIKREHLLSGYKVNGVKSVTASVFIKLSDNKCVHLTFVQPIINPEDTDVLKKVVFYS